MTLRARVLILLAAPLLLTACGEDSGWEMQLTNTVFPYGNQRTAGSGVMYVRAKMLPEKTLSLETVKRDMTPTPAPKAAEVLNNVEQKLEKALAK